MTLGIIPPKRVTEKEKQYDRDWSDQYVTALIPVRDYRGYRIETKRYFQECTYERTLWGQNNASNISSDGQAEKERRSDKDRMVENEDDKKTTRGYDGDDERLWSFDVSNFSKALVRGIYQSRNERYSTELPSRQSQPSNNLGSFRESASLGNSGDFSLKEQRKPRGHKGITSYGKRMVRNGAYMLQKLYGRKRLAFFSGTLPKLREDHMFIASWDWAEIVRRFLEELGREVNRSGREFLFIGCTEIQTKRLKKHGQFAPHLHLVYVAHDGDYNWYVTAKKLRAIWKRILEARLKYWLPDEQIEVDTSASIDTQLVKRNADSYLSKYLSKGQKDVQEIIEKGWGECIPSAWWHCCHKLKKAIKSMVTELPSDIKRAVIEGVDLVARGVMYYLSEVERDGKRYGWIGKLKPPWVQDILGHKWNTVILM